MTITFYSPEVGDPYADRADQRVRRVDHDEVTMTTKVEFSDGLRLVVRDVDLTTREIEDDSEPEGLDDDIEDPNIPSEAIYDLARYAATQPQL